MAALGFAGCALPSYDRALWALRTGLDSWPGIGHVAAGMHRQWTQYDERGWRAGAFDGCRPRADQPPGRCQEGRNGERALWCYAPDRQGAVTKAVAEIRGGVRKRPANLIGHKNIEEPSLKRPLVSFPSLCVLCDLCD